jgi:hypothetical protein
MFAAKDRPPQDAAESSRPVTVAAPARINRNLCQESQMSPFFFSRLRALLPAQNFQHPYFQSFPHSLQYGQNITPVFPITPALFVRSCACVKVSTLLFSFACALFGKTTGEGAGVIFPTLRGCGLYLEPTEKTGVGCACSPRQKRSGLYLQPTRETGNNLSRMNTYAKSAVNPRGIRTSKSLDLKSRTMNTYKKRGEGVSVICYVAPNLDANGPTFQNVTEGVQ